MSENCEAMIWHKIAQRNEVTQNFPSLSLSKSTITKELIEKPKKVRK